MKDLLKKKIVYLLGGRRKRAENNPFDMVNIKDKCTL